jgi:hypothetical protein
MRKNPFRITSDVPDEWTNPYTGQIMKPDDPQKPDKLQNKKNGFFSNPFSEHSEPQIKLHRDTEQVIPEIINVVNEKRDFNLAKQLFFDTEENNTESEPKKEIYIKNPSRIIVGSLLNELGISRDIQTEGPEINPQTNAQTKLKYDLDVADNDRPQMDVLLKAKIESMDLSDPRLNSYAQTFVAGMSPVVISTTPLQGPDDKIAHELIWDILTSKGQGSDQTVNAESTEPDLGAFLKQQILLQQNIAAAAQEKNAAMKGAEIQIDYKTNQEKLSSEKTTLSLDIQYVVKAAKTAELKNDSLVQQRVGTWALQVMGQRVKLDTSAMKKGLKKEGLQALGRIAMQLLGTMKTANAKFDLVQKEDFEQNGSK